MARIASTTSSGVPAFFGGGGGGQLTLDALMARQRQIAQAAGDISANRQMTSPWQGAAYLGEIVANKINQGRADSALAEGRQGLAEAMSGVSMDGNISGDQIAQVSQYDPDLGMQLWKMSADMMAARRAREQEIADRNEARSYEERIANEQYSRQRKDTLADQVTAAGREESKDVREEQQKIAAEERAAAAGKRRMVTGDEAVKLGGRADRIYEVSADGTQMEDVTPATGDQWVPLSPEEQAAYGDTPMQKNVKTGKISGPGGMPLVSPETGARVALGDEFLRNYDTVYNSALAGDMTGPEYITSVMMGRGPGGTAYRMLKQGTEALVRQMTGAGMSQGEAVERASQYEPEWHNDAATLASKIEGLKRALTATRSGATAGRSFPEAPNAGGEDLPTPQTQEEFDALPPGTRFIDPDDGQEYIK